MRDRIPGDKPNLPDVPGNYLLSKGLWNDPGSGRFIRRGRSTQKAKAVSEMLDVVKGEITRDRIKQNGVGLARLNDDKLKKAGLPKGTVVEVAYKDDDSATVQVFTTKGTPRKYDVKWSQFDDTYVAPGPVADVAPEPERAGGDAAAFGSLMDDWDDPDKFVRRAQERYGSWSTADLSNPQKRAEYLAAVGRAGRDADAYRRSRGAGAPLDTMPPEVLLTDQDELPGLASSDPTAEAPSVWRLADAITEFHMTPKIGETWTPMATSSVSQQLRDLSPEVGYDYDEDDTMFEGDKVAQAVATSPLMQKMTDEFGQPAISTGTMADKQVAGELQADLAHVTPEDTRLLFTHYAKTNNVQVEPQPLLDTMEGRDVVDLSYSGIVRHEYGHFLDNLYQSAFQTYANGDSSKGAERLALLDALGFDAADSSVRAANQSFLYQFLSMYGAGSPDEAIAELWALISHPDYPAYKAFLLTKVGPDTPAPLRAKMQRLLNLLNLAEVYFNPASTTMF